MSSGRSEGKGGDRGRQGRVLKRLGERVVVEGVNGRTKRTRAGRNTKSTESVQAEAPIHISNVQLVDPETKVPTRVGVRVEQVTEDGVTKTVRTRCAKKSGKDI